MTTRNDLVKIKTRALRSHLWFKTLSKIERSIIDLTIRCVTTIRSQTLQNALVNIACKITRALDDRFLPRAEKIGRKLAESLSNIGQKWGNKTASNWKTDRNFSRCLGVNHLNS
jgi:hypothetical protein